MIEGENGVLVTHEASFGPYFQFRHAAYANAFLPPPRRVKLKDGVTFLGARPCNPMLWMISQDVRVEGHRVVTLHCRKKESSYAQRSELSLKWFFV